MIGLPPFACVRFCSFVIKFIQGYVNLTKPPTDLMKKDVQLDCNPPLQTLPSKH